MAKYVENFMEWVKQMCKEYRAAPSYVRAYYGNDNDSKYTILVNHRTGEVTKAKCHENDAFNTLIGTAIAWARYKGYEIPKEKKQVTLSTLKYGQHFYHRDLLEEFTFIAELPNQKNSFIYSDSKNKIFTTSGDWKVYILV